MRTRSALFAGLLLAACAALRTVEIDGGEVRNAGPGEILDLAIVHELAFPARELEATSARFTWKTGGGASRSAEIELPPVPSELADGPVWIVYTIRPTGGVRATWQRPPR
jgi:hypothetical protein